jgi:signal transduction histidine kinase/HD-like signal output (HDOD) protein
LRLLDVLERAEPDAVELAKWIALDPALSAHLLSLFAARIGGRARGVGLEQIVAKVGVATIRGLAQAMAGDRLFSRLHGTAAVEFRHTWAHSCRAALAARDLAERVDYRWPDEAYAGGLLHDLGALAIGAAHPTDYAALMAEDPAPERRLALERERFGLSHADLGAALVERLHLNGFLVDALRYHHEPTAHLADAHLLVRIVHVAHGLASEAPAEVDGGVEAAVVLLGVDSDAAGEIAQGVRAGVEKIDAELGVDPEGGEGEDWSADAGSTAELLEIDRRIAARVEAGALGEIVHSLTTGLESEDALLAAGLQAADLLLGAGAGVCFLLDPERNRLIGRGTGGRDAALLSEMAIAASHDDSLIAEALRSGQVQASRHDAARAGVVVDAQVARLLGAPRLVAVPLASNGQRLGVMVLGATSEQAARWSAADGRLVAVSRVLATTLAELRLRQTRETRRVADSLAEVESRARQIAHEANNPLGVLRNYLSIVAGKIDESHPAQEDLRIMREEISRVAGIIRRLSDVAESPEAAGPVDLNVLVQELVRVFEDSLLEPKRIEVALDLDPSLPPIVTDRNALKQILINLVKNAAEAMQGGGRIHLATQDYVYFGDREYVELEVSDTGPGIPPHVLARLFEPVETTKGSGHSGLGLSIVRSLVAELGGLISCKSGERRGTTFRILVPREIET